MVYCQKCGGELQLIKSSDSPCIAYVHKQPGIGHDPVLPRSSEPSPTALAPQAAKKVGPLPGLDDMERWIYDSRRTRRGYGLGRRRRLGGATG